jgi:N-acetylmuramoyl-L-alanine amidase
MLLALLFPLMTFAAPLKVMIDPGHGGVDTGAVVGKSKESDIALKIAFALRDRLRGDSRFQAFLTRESDRGLSLQERVRLADRQNADLFLSIHANSSPDPRARGAEFYFQNQLPPDEESLFLAAAENKMEKFVDSPDKSDFKKDSDVMSIVQDLKRQHRLQASFHLTRLLAETWANSDKLHTNSVRQAPFYVISKSERPAVLVEVGFVTHPTEGPRLARSDEQERVAENIYRSLVRYINGRPNSARP